MILVAIYSGPKAPKLMGTVLAPVVHMLNDLWYNGTAGPRVVDLQKLSLADRQALHSSVLRRHVLTRLAVVALRADAEGTIDAHIDLGCGSNVCEYICAHKQTYIHAHVL